MAYSFQKFEYPLCFITDDAKYLQPFEDRKPLNGYFGNSEDSDETRYIYMFLNNLYVCPFIVAKIIAIITMRKHDFHILLLGRFHA